MTIEPTTRYEFHADGSSTEHTTCQGAVLMELAECSLEDDPRFDKVREMIG